MESFLEFQSVDFSYRGERPILSDLNFCVGPGEIVGFLGVNGAGKTTTFLLASGVLTPQSGEVRIMGVDPSAGRGWSESVGVLMSDAGIYPRLTVRRNLSFFAELYQNSVSIDEHLEKHGLLEYSRRRASELSQGFRRRLALARATLHNPRLLLLDEPAAGLDPGATEELYAALRGLREEGVAVMLSSHRLEEIERLCDRILILDSGTVVADDTPESLRQSHGKDLRETILSLKKP